jgi:ADP-ribose pyrophosphatase YjhB (NUDIX family)
MDIPRVTVGALVCDGEKILLIRSHKFPSLYILPGGHVEFGETLAQAVVREVREETGLLIGNVRFLQVLELIDAPEFYKHGKHFVGHNFSCEATGGELKLNEEAQEFLWCTPREALELALLGGVRETIEIYLRRK